MWIYFQALEPAALPADTAACDALFDVDFDKLRRRVRAGDAVWLEDGFFQLGELYWPHPGPGGDRELPVFGGRRIPDPHGGPGHVVLEPPRVASVAAWLDGVSFPDLWQEWRQLPSSDPDEELRELLALHHEDLLAFYRGAAQRNWAVVRHFSF